MEQPVIDHEEPVQETPEEIEARRKGQLERENYQKLFGLLRDREDGLEVRHLNYLVGFVRSRLDTLTEGDPDKATGELMEQAVDDVLNGKIEQGFGEIIEPRLRRVLDVKSGEIGFNLRGIEDRVAFQVERRSEGYLDRVTDDLVTEVIDEIMAEGQLREDEFYDAVRSRVNAAIADNFQRTDMEVSYKSVEYRLYKATEGHLDRVTQELIDQAVQDS